MKIFSLLLACMTALIVVGQPNLAFSETTHRFGEIEEMSGYATHTFSFVNSGDKPIQITQVKTSCGCSTPRWSKEEVLPGDSGFVQARYNPINRPGRFKKSLQLTTTDVDQNKILYIEGFVKPHLKNPEEEFTVVKGPLRFKNKRIHFGNITTQETVKRSIPFYNPGESLLFLSKSSLIPSHIEIKIQGDSIAAKSKGYLEVIYDPIKKADYGLIQENLLLQFKNEEQVELSVIAIIEEFFSQMTAEDLDNAPKLDVPVRSYNAGKVNEGTVVKTTFELINVGNRNLEIRKIKSNCECLTYELKSSVIESKKKKTLSVLLDTQGLRGNQYKTLGIFANDPINPTQIITVRASIIRTK